MLLDKANTIVARIAHYQTLKKQAQHAQAFETRAAQLQRAASGLRSAVDVMKGLNTAGILVGFKLSSKDQLQARTTQLSKGFASDPAFVDDPGFNLQYDYAVPLNGLSEGIKSATLKAWQSHVASLREQVSSDILNALRAVPEYRPIVATVQRTQEQIDRLAGTLPTDIANANTLLTQLTNEQRDAWQRLTGGDLPRSVVSFLRASMGDGAELQLLTTEVIDWLKTRSLDSAFRIKPRNAV
jgi:hypothetical protein